MLSTECPSGWTGQTRLSPRLACPPHASCLVPPPTPRASRRPRLTLRSTAPRAPARTLTAHSQGPWTVGNLRAMALSSASTNLHWAASSSWAHVTTVCFMRFRCMLHMFYLDVVKVELDCICCSVYTHMLQVYVQIFQLFSNVCCKLFIWMLHMLH